MTKPVNSNRPGTLPCAGGISDASTLAALAVPAVQVPREAAPPVLVLLRVVVAVHLPVLVQRLVLLRLRLRADLLVPLRLPLRADLRVEALVPAEERSVEVRHRLLSAAMAGRLPPVRRRFEAVPRSRPSPKDRRCPSA